MDLFALSASISLDIDGFYTNLDKAQKKFKSFSDSISTMSGRIDSVYKGVGEVFQPAVDGFKAVEGVGKKAGNAITTGLKGFAAAATAVGGFGAAAVKSGATFDATMSEVSAISGATGQAFQDLRDKALEMGAKTKFSASEAAEAMTYMGMAGWKAEDMISGIEGIMNLAAASGEDLATTSDIVTDALTAFGLQAGDSGHFANVMAVAASNANTNVGMMGETFKYVAPVAGALGYSVDDTALAIGLMANSGIKATQAGTALRSIFTRLSTDAGASSKSLGALGTLTQKLGVEFYNTDGSARNLNDVLVDSRAAWAGLSEEQQITYAKTIAGQEAMSGWLALMNAAPADVEKLTAALEDCNGAAEKMATTMVDNLQGDITLMKSAFESLQIAISDSLTPTLREFAQFGQKAMAGLLEGFQGSGVSGFMSALSGIVTNGVTMLAGKAPEFASVSLQFIQALADGILGARSEITIAASTIFSMLINGIGSWLSTNSGELIAAGDQIIAVLFSAFSKAGSLIQDNIGQFIPLITRAFIDYHDALFSIGMDILGAIGQGIVDSKDYIQGVMATAINEMSYALQVNAPMIIDGAIALLEALVGAIEENLPYILEAGAAIVGELVTGISTASPAVQAIIGTAVLPHILKIVDTVGKIGGAVSSVVSVVGGAINTIISIGGKLIGGIQALWGLLAANPITLVIAAIAALVAAFALLWNNCEEFRNFWIGLWDGIKSVVSTAIDAIVGFFHKVIDFIKGNWQGILLFIVNPFAGAFKLIYDNCETFRNFINGLMNSVKEIFQSGWEAVKGFFVDAWDAIKSAWDTAVDFFAGIGEGIQAAFEAVASFLGDAFSAAWDLVSSVWGAAVGFFENVWDGISGVFSAVSDWFGEKFSAAWDAVCSAWDGAVDFFSGVLDNILGVFGSIWDKFKEIGGNIVDGIKNGISNAWNSFMSWLDSKVGGIVQGVKNMLGIHSPSTVFAGIGENMALGLASGWDDEYAGIKRKIESGLSFGTASVGVNANYSGSSRYGSQEAAGRPGGWGNTTVNIYSPEAVDGAEAARVWKKETQKMAISYV